MASAQVHSFLRIPAGLLSAHEIAKAKADLLVHPRGMDGEPAPAPIANYRTMRCGGIAVPIHWGMERWPGLPIEDCTSKGRPLEVRCLPDPHHPKAGEGQAAFTTDLLDKAQSNYVVLAKAGTGTGKTVASLSVAGQIGYSTIVFVHLDRLAKQWADEAVRHLGLKRSEIGFIQGDLCQWQRPFVIAMLQTMNLRHLPPEARLAFGTSIFDEVHRMGARTFATALTVFPTAIKIALSATPTRKDGAEKVFLQHFGAPIVTLDGEALRAKVETARFVHETPVPNLKHPGTVRYLTRSAARNRFILAQIMRMAAKGRKVLIIGDSIRHLQALQAKAIEAGLSERKCGLLVGYTYTGRFRWRPIKPDPMHRLRAVRRGTNVLLAKPFARPLHQEASQVEAVFYDRAFVRRPDGTTLTVPLRFLTQAERIAETRAVKDAEKSRIMRQASFIFTTYGQFKEGIDCARLDAGIDVTPRSEAEQVIGRIRRKLGDREKQTPWWITPLDVGCARAERYYKARKREYLKCNVEML